MIRGLEYVGDGEVLKECMKHPYFWEINEDARVVLVTAVQEGKVVRDRTLVGRLVNYTGIGDNSFSLWDVWDISEEGEQRRPISETCGYELTAMHVPLEQITRAYFVSNKGSIRPCLPKESI